VSNGNVFAITTQEAGTIELEPGARRQVVFNVQNLTGRPIDGRARAVVEGMPAQQAWYTVQGRMERRFDVDEVHQFIVEVAIPEDAQGGRYSFALEVNSVSRPDEDFGRSEKLLVVVPEPAKPGGGPSVPWWVWVVAASVLVVVGGVVAWIVISDGDQVEVPDLEGDPVADAMDELDALGLAADTVLTLADTREEHGIVRTQDPDPGAEVEPGATVTLTVAWRELARDDRHVVSVDSRGDRLMFTLEALSDFTDNLAGQYPQKDFAGIRVDVNGNGQVDSRVDVAYGISGGSRDTICTQYLLSETSSTGCTGFSSSADLGVGFRATSKESRPHPVWEFTIPKSELRAGGGSAHMVFWFFSAGEGYSSFPRGVAGQRPTSFQQTVEVDLSSL
jgi:hypothetical protein